jgi:uncharacterized protein YggT (Ycf19 family)
LISFSIKKGIVIGAVLLATSIAIDVALCWMQVCVALSWVVGYASPIRRFFLPTLSVPIHPRMLMGNKTQEGGVLERVSNMGGMDIGPMVTLWALQWVSKKLEEMAAAAMLPELEEKNKRRETRQEKRGFGFTQYNEGTGDLHVPNHGFTGDARDDMRSFKNAFGMNTSHDPDRDFAGVLKEVEEEEETVKKVEVVKEVDLDID